MVHSNALCRLMVSQRVIAVFVGSTPTTARYNLCFNIILPIIFSSISCNKLHVTRSIISYCSVHLDARVIPPRCVICDFVLDARSNHARHVIYPFRAFTISCNKLHATRSIISHCSVHLDARVISPRCVICDSVLDARPNHARYVI